MFKQNFIMGVELDDNLQPLVITYDIAERDNNKIITSHQSKYERSEYGTVDALLKASANMLKELKKTHADFTNDDFNTNEAVAYVVSMMMQNDYITAVELS